MKKSIKAVLLSAFVLPGAGHFFLKKPIMGCILAVAAFAGLYSIVASTITKSLKVAEQIQNSSPPLNLAEVSELVSQQIMHSDVQQMNMALAALLIAWVVGMVDAFRLGYKLDKLSK